MARAASPTAKRVLYVDPHFTIFNEGQTSATPEGTFDNFGTFLERVARVVKDDGLVLLDEDGAAAFRLPTTADVGVSTGLGEASEAGWSGYRKTGWSTFTKKDRPNIAVGILSIIDTKRCPLFPAGPAPAVIDDLSTLEWAMSATSAFDLWHQFTGTAWRGTPGVAGMVTMRQFMPDLKVRGKSVPPTWKATAGPVDAAERDYTLRCWRGEIPHVFEHGYDANRMYLAAAGACETLAPWALRHTPERKTFDPKLAGWWKLELSPWNDPRIPNPAGPVDGMIAWVTTPTATLLSQLTEEGAYGGFLVLDSWTGPGKRLLRRWAESLEKAFQGATEAMGARDEDGQPNWRCRDAERVRGAAKEVYRESVGMLNRPTNSIHRPDWHASIIALARCNLWRKMWGVGQVEDVWPLAVDVDNVWYPAAAEDPEQGKPLGVVLGTRLGQFKVKGTRAVAA